MASTANLKVKKINQKYKIFAIFLFSNKSSLKNFQIQANLIDMTYRQRIISHCENKKKIQDNQKLIANN